MPRSKLRGLPATWHILASCHILSPSEWPNKTNYFASSNPHHDMSKCRFDIYLVIYPSGKGFALNFMSVSSHFPRFFLLFSRSSSPPLLQPSAPGLSAVVQRHFALSSSRPIFASVHTRNNVRKRPVHLWSFYSHCLSNIFSDILSGTSPNMLTFFVTYLLDILSGIYSESLSGIPPSILSDTLSDIPSDILSD